MVYGKIFCKPFSKTREALCSLSLFFFSAISLCSLSLQVRSGFLWVFWVQFSFSFRFCRSAGSVFFASPIRLPLGFLGSVFFFFSILQVRRLSFLFGSALCRSGFSFWWVTGCAVGQSCGFLFQWVTGCCLGFYSRWVAVVICWWATGCCGASLVVSADLHSPSFFFCFWLRDLWVYLFLNYVCS